MKFVSPAANLIFCESLEANRMPQSGYLQKRWVDAVLLARNVGWICISGGAYEQVHERIEAV